MGSLLSAISGQFAKVVTLGTMFPVLIVSGLNLIFVALAIYFFWLNRKHPMDHGHHHHR